VAKVTNSFSSYNATANREDLSDVIYNISPADTPLISAIGKRKVTQPNFDWQVESLSAVNGGASAAQQEGFVASVQASTPTSRQRNVTQILAKTASVTGSQEASLAAGKKSELAHQLSLRSRELKRDLEATLIGAQARVDGDDTGPTARVTRGFEHALISNVSTGTGYAAPASATATLTDGTTRALTETMVLDVMQSAYTNGGEPTILMVPPALRRRVSSFSGRAATQVPVGTKEAVQTISVYETDFGILKVATNKWMRARTALLIDPSMARVAYFRNFAMSDLAKTGDAESKLLVVEAGLQTDNEAAHGKIADLT
jgi:hypothetical protein